MREKYSRLISESSMDALPLMNTSVLAGCCKWNKMAAQSITGPEIFNTSRYFNVTGGN